MSHCAFLSLLKYSVKRRSTQTSDLYVSLILHQVLRGCPSDLDVSLTFSQILGVHLPCHVNPPTIYSMHSQTKKFKKYQYEERYRPL